MTEQNSDTTPPTAEAQAEIAQAAAEKAAAGGSQAQVADAAQEAARAQGVELTDEQAKQIAAQLTGPLVEGILAGFDQRGVFREEPEPVQPSPAAPPAPADGGTPAAAPAATAAHQEAPGEAPPVKQSWADRHFG